jgi:cAMP-dependent protein kinase regulator
MSAVQFDSNDSGGKKVPRRATVCSEVYKEEEIDNFVPDVIEKDAKVKRYLLTLLERHDLFSHLEDYELSVAVDAMYERENSKGDTLYEIGDESDTFYILYQGKVEQRGKHADDVTLKKKGDTMQDLVLLYPDNSRETAVCVEDCMLYTLDRQTYRCILSKASKKKRALYEGFLSTIGFLKAANLTRSEILSLADALKGDQFEAGGSMIKYGEVGETFYIICEGVVEVYGRDEASNVIKVCEFTVGDCVGELEFINNHKCVADVKAKGFVRVAKMNRHHFEMVMGPVKDVLARNASENTVYEYYRQQLEKMEKDEKH